MTYSALALTFLLLSSLFSCAMESDCIVEKNTSDRLVPSLYLFALKAVAKKLVAEDTIDASMIYGDEKHKALSSFDFIEQFSGGKWLKLSDDKKALRDILKREYFTLLVDIFKDSTKPIVLEHENDVVSQVVSALAFSPDGKKLAVLTSQLTIWDWSDLSAPEMVLKRGILSSREGALRWSSDGTTIFSCTRGRLICWDLVNRKRMWVHNLPEKIAAQRYKFYSKSSSCAFSPDGKYLLDTVPGPKKEDLPNYYCPHFERSLHAYLFKLDDFSDETNKVDAEKLAVHEKNFIEGSNEVGQRLVVSFSPDGTYALTAGCDCTVRIHHMNDLMEDPLVLEHKGIVCSAAFSPDSKKLVVAVKESEKKSKEEKKPRALHTIVFYLWDLETKTSKKLKKIIIDRSEYSFTCNNPEFPKAIAFDGRFIVFQIDYGNRSPYRGFKRKYTGYRTYLCDTQKEYAIVMLYESQVRLNKIVFSKDGSLVALASGKSTCVSLRPLLGASECFTPRQLLLIAKLCRNVLKKELKGEALKILESLYSEDNDEVYKRIMEYFALQ